MKVDHYWKERLNRCAQRAREYLAQHQRDQKYHITCRAYDEDLKKFLDPVHVTIEVTDEEYEHILSHMLSVNYPITFNSLLKLEPRIAQKINLQALSTMEDNECQDFCPFLIQLDEFHADRNAISEDPEFDLPF